MTASSHRSADIRVRALERIKERKPNNRLVEDLASFVEKAGAKDVRLRAIAILGSWGPKARPAGRVLLRIANGGDEELAAVAEDALSKIR